MPPAVEESAASTGDKTSEESDIRWTDAQVRWPEDGEKQTTTNTEESDEDEDDTNPFDPFADPDPTEVFSFRFAAPPGHNEEEDEPSIHLDIHGYKTGSDQVWESTGLTLWKASKYLCDYMVQHADQLRGQRVIELGAGLGLNGILAHRLGAESVVVTDGDSDAMVELRKNIAVNRRSRRKDQDKDLRRILSAAQLIWGEEFSQAFLQKETTAEASSGLFSITLASDVVYAPQVIDPLFATVRILLERPGGEFWMAFAVRKVPVTIEFVLEKARDHGFRYELVDQQQEGGDGDDDENNSGGGYGIDDDPETGPVFVYVFRWDTEDVRDTNE